MTAPKESPLNRGVASVAYGTGRSTSGQYVRLWKPGHPLAASDGYVLEHRYILYEAKVEIPPGHHVHHRNGDKHDNRLDNLEVLSVEEHVAEHTQVGTPIVNQFGTFPVRTLEEKRALARARHKKGQESRVERLAADPTLAPHGSVNTYTNWGCRCAVCKSAFSAAVTARRRRGTCKDCGAIIQVVSTRCRSCAVRQVARSR